MDFRARFVVFNNHPEGFRIAMMRPFAQKHTEQEEKRKKTNLLPATGPILDRSICLELHPPSHVAAVGIDSRSDPAVLAERTVHEIGVFSTILLAAGLKALRKAERIIFSERGDGHALNGIECSFLLTACFLNAT
jgi:hypothetical protein